MRVTSDGVSSSVLMVGTLITLMTQLPSVHLLYLPQGRQLVTHTPLTFGSVDSLLARVGGTPELNFMNRKEHNSAMSQIPGKPNGLSAFSLRAECG